MIIIKAPKISIIIATYNSARTIEQAIRSVISQTYENYQLIVIDGNSSDNTFTLLRKYKKDIDVLVSEKDTGIYNALNKGVRLAKGDYVYILGSDDCLYQEDTLKTISPYLDGAVVVCADVMEVDEFSGYEKKASAKERLSKLTVEESMPHHQGMFMRADVIKQCLFDENFKVAADYDLFWRVIQQYGISAIRCVDVTVAFFSVGLGATSNLKASISEYVSIMKKNSMAEQNIERYRKHMIVSMHRRSTANRIIKPLLIKMDLLKFIRMKQGWHKHICNWDSCRWCSKVKG